MSMLNMIIIQVYTESYFLDSGSDEMNSGNGDSATSTQDGDDDLLSSHF